MASWLILEFNGNFSLAVLLRILNNEAFLVGIDPDGLTCEELLLQVRHDVAKGLFLQVLADIEEQVG